MQDYATSSALRAWKASKKALQQAATWKLSADEVQEDLETKPTQRAKTPGSNARASCELL